MSSYRPRNSVAISVTGSTAPIRTNIGIAIRT